MFYHVIYKYKFISNFMFILKIDYDTMIYIYRSLFVSANSQGGHEINFLLNHMFFEKKGYKVIMNCFFYKNPLFLLFLIFTRFARADNKNNNLSSKGIFFPFVNSFVDMSFLFFFFF